jgi:hypothetical protein
MMGGWNRTYEAMPAVGHVVEVWYMVTCILATWTGSEWRTVDGVRLTQPIVNWREYRA